jgi:uncharacterized protein (DUF58 family)
MPRPDGVPRIKPTWPTRLGAMFIVLILVIGGAAIVFSNNLFYLVVAMMLGFIAVSGIIAEYTLSGIKARLTAAPEIFAGRPTSLVLELSNEKSRFASFGLAIRHGEDGPWGRDRLRLMHLPPGGDACVTWATEWPKRGWVDVKGVWIATRFPFCMWDKANFVPCPARFLVFPSPAPAPEVETDAAAPSGSMERAVRGVGLSVVSLRDYVPGDSYRLIHWKRSARTGQLQIKEMEQETDRAVTVVLAGDLGDRLEAALSLATGLLLDLDEKAIPFGLVTHAHTGPTSTGKAHLRASLAELAVLEAPPAGWAPPAGALDRLATRVVVVHAGTSPPAWADARFDGCVAVEAA